MGYAVTVAGLGPIVLPIIFTLLLKFYAPSQVILIMAGACANVFVAGALVQPVKWHMKTLDEPEQQIELLEKKDVSPKIVQMPEVKPEKKPLVKRILGSIFKVFDLDLLKDPVFNNILIGLSLANFAELNYTLLLPFILNDFELTTDEIAIFLSVLAVADLIFRFIGPHIGNYFTMPSRIMYAFALAFLVVIRFCKYYFVHFLFFCSYNFFYVIGFLATQNYYALLVIAFLFGCGKGFRKVYMYLVIPDHVAVDKLASSGGMETLTNGICILLGGPILGALRDATGSYKICIIVMNCITIFTVLIWSLEILILKYWRKKPTVNGVNGVNHVN